MSWIKKDFKRNKKEFALIRYFRFCYFGDFMSLSTIFHSYNDGQFSEDQLRSSLWDRMLQRSDIMRYNK